VRNHIALFVSALFIASSVSVACAQSTSNKTTQPAPALQFIRPLADERFFDYPIFVQLFVSGFHLVTPGEPHNGKSRENYGYIRYKFDDYPVVATDDTQFMIGKKLGANYLPVGLHVLKAELVDETGKPLNPPAETVTEVFTGHPATVEAINTAHGSQRAELTAAELYKMRVHMEQIESELRKLKAGDAGYTPMPVQSGQTAE